MTSGVRLLEVGFIRLLISRQPQTLDAAQRIAAEHFAFSDEARKEPSRHPRDRAGLGEQAVLGFLVGLAA